jgi:hypothetical protein
LSIALLRHFPFISKRLIKPERRWGASPKLLRCSLLSRDNAQPWDISPDGKRFLMIRPQTLTGTGAEAAQLQPKINIVVNWFEQLKQRVPVK